MLLSFCPTANVRTSFIHPLKSADLSALPGLLYCSGDHMPTYEYECKKCGHDFKLDMALDQHEKRKPRCPKCKSPEVKHVMAPVFVTTPSKS